MRTRNILTFLLFMAAASLTFTSCLDDDDDNKTTTNHTLTKAEKELQAEAIQGFYTGNFLFDNDSLHIVDSVAVHWQVTAPDTTLTLPSFPVSILAKNVSNTLAKSILSHATPQTIQLSFYLFYNENNSEGYYTFMLTPPSTLSFPIMVDGVDHQATLNFTTSVLTYNSYGQQVVFYPTGAYMKGQMSMYILLRNITIDYVDYNLSNVFMITGKK